MHRALLSKNLSRAFHAECLQQRSYAIMTRAKHRAGLPVEAPSPQTILGKKAKKPTANPAVLKQGVDKWRQPAHAGQQVNEEAQRAALKARMENINFRKPAGISERLIKTNQTIVQPENPHLIKVAVIGAANAGKSTLVNKIVGEEVSGVSPKAHTTRERVLAVLSEGNYQIVFLDTPGVIPDHNHAKMNRTLSTSSWRSLDEADHVLVIVDASRSVQPQARATEDFLLERLRSINLPATLIFNKMDLLHEDKEQLDEVVERYNRSYPNFKKTLFTSAVYEDGLETVKNVLYDESIQKPWIYPADQTTEMSDVKRVEEAIRIEFFKRLHQYIPYMLRQENVGWTEMKDGTLRIDQNVYVERDSQQKIVIGYQGRIINAVVEEARSQISKALKRPVKLFIQVKTRKSAHQ